MGHIWVMKWVIIGHRWVSDRYESQMGRRMGCKCVGDESLLGHELGSRWVINESHIRSHNVAYEFQMNRGMSYIDGWQMGHGWVTHWVYFRIHHFSSSPNAPISDSVTTFATLRIRKLHVIFDQSEEGNPVVSFPSLLWRFKSWSFALRVF